MLDQLEALGGDPKNPQESFTIQGLTFTHNPEDATNRLTQNLFYHTQTEEGYPLDLTLMGDQLKVIDIQFNDDKTAGERVGVTYNFDPEQGINAVNPIIAAAKYRSTQLSAAHIDPETLAEKVPKKLTRREAREQRRHDKMIKKRFEEIGADFKNPEKAFRFGGITFTHKQTFDYGVIYETDFPSKLELMVSQEAEGQPYKLAWGLSPESSENVSYRNQAVDQASLARALPKIRKDQMDREQASPQ